MNEFFVIDVETANASRRSICQIGIVRIVDGHVVWEFESLINPETWFEEINVAIHGIRPEDVAAAPTIHDIAEELALLLEGEYLIGYGAFDKQAINLALPNTINAKWINGTAIVRRTWPQFSFFGYGLKNITKFLNIPLDKHHNALVDAIAAGRVVSKAIEVSGISIQEWAERALIPLHTKAEAEKPTLNPNGILFGEVAAITGSLSLPRFEVERIAMNAGCDVKRTVNSKTTLLISGVQTESRIKGGLSSKEKKAIDLIKKGQEIQIISEDYFFDLIKDLKV